MQGKHEILLGLTTTPGSDWKKKIEDIDKFGIERLALFPTFLKPKKRKELYKLLEKTNLKEIPHVHLRDNELEDWEIEYLKNRYKTQVFNIHGKGAANGDFKGYADSVYIENQYYKIDEKYLKEYAGMCIDFTHLEIKRLRFPKKYKHYKELIKNYKVGCCHVSAIKGIFSVAFFLRFGKRDWHMLGKLKELDYMKKYKEFLPRYISIELENDFEKQIEVKRYLEKILNISAI